MKKFSKYILTALLAILFIGTFVFLFKKSKPAEVRYQELEVTVGDIQRTTVVTGKIIPRNEVNIKPQINGIIAELYKEAGQQVKEGDVLEIMFGTNPLKVEVLSVKETVKKEEAKEMYKVL